MNTSLLLTLNFTPGFAKSYFKIVKFGDVKVRVDVMPNTNQGKTVWGVSFCCQDLGNSDEQMNMCADMFEDGEILKVENVSDIISTLDEVFGDDIRV